MAQRFGEFFNDPEWPFQNQNAIELANLFNDYSDQNTLCKLQDLDLSKIKIEYGHQQDQENQMKMEGDVQEQESYTQIFEESQNVVVKQEEIQEDESQQLRQPEQSQYELNIQQKMTCTTKIKIQTNKDSKTYKLDQFKRNPLKSLLRKKKKELERGRYNILSEQLKKQIVQECKNMTMVQVSRKYHVSVNNICRWRKRCDRRSGAGRKVTDMEMQSKLLNWILQQTQPIPRKQVQTMAKAFSGQQDFKASKGWFQRFYKRNKLEYHPNVEILTYNDYRQRLQKQFLERCNKIKLEPVQQCIQPYQQIQNRSENVLVKLEHDY